MTRTMAQTIVRTILRGLSIFNPRLRAPARGLEVARHLQLSAGAAKLSAPSQSGLPNFSCDLTT